MTSGHSARVLVWFLVASLAHVPLPVWDGDNVGSRGAVAAPGAGSPRDVDLILLGCDPPDDCDDGPTDDDPDDGTLDSGLGPAYLTASAAVPPGGPDAAPAGGDPVAGLHDGPAGPCGGQGAFTGWHLTQAERTAAACVLRL